MAKTVQVVRPFYYQGKPTKKGDRIELPDVFAQEMVNVGKAEFSGDSEEPLKAPKLK